MEEPWTVAWGKTCLTLAMSCRQAEVEMGPLAQSLMPTWKTTRLT